MSDNRGWTLDINRLQIADSLLIWQRSDNDQINVRDINLELKQGGQRQVQVTLASRVNRNQRDLTFSMVIDADMHQYPRQFSANISQFTYKLEGLIFLQRISGGGRWKPVIRVIFSNYYLIS